MKFQLPPALQRRLANQLWDSLELALQNPYQREPQLVANLVYHIPRAVNSLGPLSGRTHTVKAGGVFVHQQPQVLFDTYPKSSPKRVEIGDLLLLRTEVRDSVVHSRSALLLQAKKYKTLPVAPDNKNQYYLYANWPKFTYIGSTKELNGKKRHVVGLDMHSASKYLLLGSNPQGCVHCPLQYFPAACRCGMTAQPTSPSLNHYRCFLQELFDFIMGDVGKSFNRPPQPWTKGWDRVMDDLIKVTAKRATEYIRGAFPGTNPYRGQGLCFVTGHFSDKGAFYDLLGNLDRQNLPDDGPPEVPAEYYEDDLDGSGISTIEFIVSSLTQDEDL